MVTHISDTHLMLVYWLSWLLTSVTLTLRLCTDGCRFCSIFEAFLCILVTDLTTNLPSFSLSLSFCLCVRLSARATRGAAVCLGTQHFLLHAEPVNGRKPGN